MSQENLRIIVIGGGAAGISAASTSKGLLPDASITLFTEFEDVAYSPCGIPFVLGKEIATLVNKKQSSGRYAVEFNASSLSSGIYYYRLKAGNFTQIKKMILLK